MPENENRLEGRAEDDGEPLLLKSAGEHIRGGVNLTLSNVRYSMEDDAVYRRDVANMLDSWLVDLQESLRYLRSGDESSFHRGYSSVIKSMIKVFFTITSREERAVYRDGKIL